MGWREWLGACGLLVAGCGPIIGGAPDGESSGETESTRTTGPASSTGDASTATVSTTSSTTTGGLPSSTVTTTTVGSSPTEPTDPTDDTGSETGDDTLGKAFICHHCTPDGGGVSFECDVFEQDCRRGEKCTAWANDGGNSWNATKCVPVQPDPDGPGETCTVVGSGVSGVDSCDLGSMCFYVDAETNVGRCVELCTGSEAEPVCGDGFVCSVSNAGSLNLCIESCDPLLQDCPDGEGCHPFGESFTCLPTTEEPGGQGAPCEFLASCQPGLFCIDALQLPACDAAGCCTPFCSLDGDPSLDCPDFPTTSCQPAYDEGLAPPGYENLGYCAIAP